MAKFSQTRGLSCELLEVMLGNHLQASDVRDLEKPRVETDRLRGISLNVPLNPKKSFDVPHNLQIT